MYSLEELEEVEARERCFLYFFITILFFVGVAISIIEKYEKEIRINVSDVAAKSINPAEYYRAPGIPIFSP